MLQFIPVVIVALGLAACAKVASDIHNGSTLKSLAGSEWSPVGGMDQFVQFKSKGEMSGFSGCNNFFGQYEQNGEQLIIGPLASTKKACFDKDIMAREQSFLQALQNTHHVLATHKELVLKDRDGEVLVTLLRKDWD